MAEHYIRTSFTLILPRDEVALLNEIRTTYLDGLDESELRDLYRGHTDAFRALFPEQNGDPFGSYRSLFDDPENPQHSFALDFAKGPHGRYDVAIFGDNIEPVTLANIIHAVCKSALPFGFTYSYGCTKLRPGEFGGGYSVITDNEVIFRDTITELERSLKEIADEDARQLVITKRNPEDGLDFWNNESGFGRLADATIFTPAEAQLYDLPIADDQPEWLTMPRRA